MCTALTLNTKDFYFGRTLDLDCSYGEEISITPRRYPIEFTRMGKLSEHYAIIGMATVVGDYPLYYDAANEYGLAMAGLNFPENAHYFPEEEGKDNVSPFEFIPWVLSQCKDLCEARDLLSRINLVNIPFSEKMPLAPLHWIISDKSGSLVAEQMKDGLHIHENPIGVMTNNPPFEYQMFNLNNYRNLRVDNGEDSFSKDMKLKAYCQGLGGLGLPGDLSSMSRFVRIAFGRVNSVCEEDERSSVNQFFRLLSTVEMTRGLCLTDHGTWDISVYTSCINATEGRYYYVTYDNRTVNSVNMREYDLDGDKLCRTALDYGN